MRTRDLVLMVRTQRSTYISSRLSLSVSYPIFMFICATLVMFTASCGEVEDSTDKLSAPLSAQSGATDGVDSRDLPADSANTIEHAPLNAPLSADKRLEYYQILSGVHQEVSDGVTRDQVALQAASDPNEECDRCGRETGFLPAPELLLTQFIPVEMKLITIGLVSWLVDVSEAEEIMRELFGEEVVEQPDFSYRLTLARVDLDHLDVAQRALAIEGGLLASGDTDAISVTSLTTTEPEAAISFEHGLAYVFSISLVEGTTKLTSLASAPVMVYCPSAVLDTLDSEPEWGATHFSGGCLQLLPPLEVIDE